MSETQEGTPNQDNDTLTNVDSNVPETLSKNENRPQLVEPSQISNEIQALTENVEQRYNNRIMKMIEEMENELDAILKEIKSNKSASTVTNPRSEINDTQNMQPSGTKLDYSIGVHASHNKNSDSEDEDYPQYE